MMHLSKGLEAMEWIVSNTITPDGGKLMVGHGHADPPT